MCELDVDPGFGDDSSDYGSDLQSYTTSLASAATDYKFIHGRRYHAYEEGRYVFPNDQQESDRLDIMHQVVLNALGGLYTAPVKDPKRVLDLATGTGIWAIELGEAFPQAEITGNDLSPIQPHWVPPNVHFEVDDIEKPWTYSRPFDFIHSRGLYGAIKDWPALIKQCFDNTAPGGYCELTDWDSKIRSPDNSIPKDSSFQFFYDILGGHLEQAGITVSPGPSLEQWAKDAGFEIVKSQVTPLPYGLWPRDKKLKEVGAWNYLQLSEGLESYAMYILHVHKGWSKEEVDVLCAKVRTELKNKRIHYMLQLHNVVCRKPEDKAETSD